MKRIISGRFGLLFVAFAVLGCDETRSQPADEIARINDVIISVDDFQESYVNYLVLSGENDTRRIRYRHLDNLIDAILLEEAAVRNRLDTTAEFKRFVDREERKAIGSVFFEDAFLATLPELTDQQIRDAFRKSKEKRVVRHLFYRDPKLADEAYARLRAGRSFVDEAQICYDLAEYDSSAGYIGPVEYFQIDPSFAKIAFETPIDSFSAPVRSRFGYHIVQVDDAFYNPLITESEYQTKKKGTASRLRHLIRLTQGDGFVRSYMEAMNVRVDRNGILALTTAIHEIENSVDARPAEIVQNGEQDAVDLTQLLDSFSPSTVLATYEFDGRERTFTADDYYFWLDELPFAEASSRTAASVGRALRNEVFAMAGREAGLADDERVLAIVAKRKRLKLAEQLRESLRQTRDVVPTDAELQSAYDESGMADQVRWIGSFWTIPFSSRVEAEQARATIASGRTSPQRYSGFEEFADEPVGDHPNLKSAVVTAPENTPLVVGLRKDWVVLNVSDRKRLPFGDEQKFEEIARAISPLIPEYRLLRNSRSGSTMVVDTLRFEALMRLGND